MGIKAFIPAGQTALTVNGLHQWDYGQKLEIHDDSLPALIEVHFACTGMKDAIVRSCSVLQGVAEVAIPDQCLEQITPITAYIYEVGESSGATTKVIVLTVTPRPRPLITGAITPTISDKYTELMGAVNEQVHALKAGNVTVSRALIAEKAITAEKADSLADPENTQVGFADKATEATTAAWSSRAGRLNITQHTTAAISDTGLYLVMWKNSAGVFMTDLLFIDTLRGHDISTTGGYDGTSHAPGPCYTAYDQTINIMHEGSIVAVYKIADYTPAV